MTLPLRDTLHSAVLRFDSDVGPRTVTAFISHAALSARYGGSDATSSEMLSIVTEHRTELDAAVARRVAAGGRQPVILWASDL